ncbi:GntR family transcriptional regulator [Paramaledivibacter caminithermalis]|uniref:DNA-binding transcriptional regulator, GntR family n=1 Tax=Paramaledivibacter caminithermalis (strain DSM 15212 / CIP 107654 / DViRD3) TaxID=1121301 RepID=A0A1M6T2R6_PARC5|nr:GntR family transcriptional regulator [Paramaledivibacter caminithermalis]SHK51209.1 DNA-binding transcriptional regulator, GntR family [Paramaledivibacter caminithermalis DSM 15212]
MENIFNEKKGNKSLTSMIFEKIREDILIGKYTSGEKIVEAKLAEEFGVSRTPVREALKQLELDGLVDNIPNRGVIVKGISNQDVEDIYTIRIAIEGIAVKWAIERMDENDLQKLKEIFELMEFYSFKKDIDKIAELNTKFHETIYNATKSRYLEHVLKDFQYFMKTTRYKSLRSPGRMESALEEHRKILEAFTDRDIDRAAEAILKHVNNSRDNAKKVSTKV